MSEISLIPSWADPEASQQLLELCARGEGQHLEFKERLPAQGHDIGKAIAAFSSSGGGLLLYGISDAGDIVGIQDAENAGIRDQVAQRILNAAKEVRPPVHPHVSWAVHDGKCVCFVKVDRGFDAIYYSNQRPIVRRGCTSRPAEPLEVEQIFRQRYVDSSNATKLPSTQQIAKRLRNVLEKMNEGRLELLEVSDLALALGLSAPAELEVVMEGNTPATFDLLDRFCTRFAVNKEWLTTGRSTPFYSQIEHRSLPEEYLGWIDEAGCETVYAVRSKSHVGESFLVVESEQHRFQLLPDVWHVSEHVGGGGSRDLASLCSLFEVWSRGSRPYMVLGRLIDVALAEAIWNGQKFPGIVADLPLSHWWDDLTDLEHRWTSRNGSMKAYGKAFVAAQDIIRHVRLSR